MSPKVESMGFYCCPYTRCPVRYWPTYVGDQCPVCEKQGVYAGIAVKVPEIPPQEDT